MAQTQRELRPGDALRTAFAVFGAHPVSLLLISAVGTLFGILTLVTPILGLFGVFGTEVVSAGMAYFIFVHLTGGTPTFNASFERVFDRLIPLIETTLRLIGAMVLLSITIIGIPWAIRLAVRWSFATLIVVFTNETAKEAISHSCRLVDGLWWPIFLTFLVLTTVSLSVTIVVTLLWPSGAAGQLISLAWRWPVTVVITGFWTAMYLQLDKQDRARQAEAL